MKQTDIDLLKMVMQRNEIDVRTIAQVIEDIKQEQAADADEEKEPAVKKQFVVILDDAIAAQAGREFTGWVVQIPEDENPATACEKLIRAGYEFNTTKKGRRMPVKHVREVCEFVSEKILKEQKVWVKTKEPVFVLASDGVMPGDAAQAKGEQ